MKRWTARSLVARFSSQSIALVAQRAKRWAIVFIAWYALLTGMAGVFPSVAHAQTQAPDPTNAPRNFPRNALRGSLQVTQPPLVQIDGNPEKLSPGSRIRGPNGLLVMSGAIVGQTFTVNYVRDSYGLVHEVWILTPEEVALRRSNSPQQGFSTQYDASPLPDYANTPYNQLPGYRPQAAPAGPAAQTSPGQ